MLQPSFCTLDIETNNAIALMDEIDRSPEQIRFSEVHYFLPQRQTPLKY